MDDLNINFLYNSTWFDIKFLTKSQTTDKKKIIKDKFHSAAVGKACKELQISTKNKVHIGWKLGSFESELNEDETQRTYEVLEIGTQRHRKSFIQQSSQ